MLKRFGDEYGAALGKAIAGEEGFGRAFEQATASIFEDSRHSRTGRWNV